VAEVDARFEQLLHAYLTQHNDVPPLERVGFCLRPG